MCLGVNDSIQTGVFIAIAVLARTWLLSPEILATNSMKYDPGFTSRMVEVMLITTFDDPISKISISYLVASKEVSCTLYSIASKDLNSPSRVTTFS